MTGTVHIVVAMKPGDGNFAGNAVKHGVSGLNVDGCRIQGPKGSGVWGTSNKTINTDRKFNASPDMTDYRSERHGAGRWPANVAISHCETCRRIGTTKVKGYVINRWDDGSKPFGGGAGHGFTTHKMSADGTEEVETWECADECPVRALGGQSGQSKSTGGRTVKRSGGGNVGSHKDSEKWWSNDDPGFGDTGTAARYFKQVTEFVE